VTAEDAIKTKKKETIFLPFKRRKSKLNLGYGKEFRKFLKEQRDNNE
jgi:hypothetical protein